MIYIKKVKSRTSGFELFKGGPGKWYSKGLGGWSILPRRGYFMVIKSLDEAAERGYSSYAYEDGNTKNNYLRITEEEAAMILFQHGWGAQPMPG